MLIVVWSCLPLLRTVLGTVRYILCLHKKHLMPKMAISPPGPNHEAFNIFQYFAPFAGLSVSFVELALSFVELLLSLFELMANLNELTATLIESVTNMFI
jgi:hypothetical protein